jgi:hypothetical protein
MENAVSRLENCGAVRHGAEAFNYYFPQDLDEEFLIISDDLPGNLPWKYVDVKGLQDFLSERIDDGYAFPLNPKWILCDAGKWVDLYCKLLLSDKQSVSTSMNIWFPQDVRKHIDSILSRHPNGL